MEHIVQNIVSGDSLHLLFVIGLYPVAQYIGSQVLYIIGDHVVSVPQGCQSPSTFHKGQSRPRAGP